MSPKIYSAEAISYDELKVTYFDGSIRKVDMKKIADVSRQYIAVINDKQNFKKVEVDKSKGRLVWPNGIKLSGEMAYVNSVVIDVVPIKDAVINFAERLRVYRESLFMTQKELGEKTGIDQADISKIERAEVNPSLSTMSKLIEGTGHSLHFSEEKPRVQGEYKIWDVLNMPGDDYIELINGVMYVMGSPTIPHQHVISEIQADISSFIRNRGGKCLVFGGLTGVRFEEDDSNYFLPDLLVVCDRSKIKREGIFGAPDFVLEVISKSSIKNDTVRKLGVYEERGVREYWVIDPDRERLIVYDFENDEVPMIHTFDEEVPVGIYKGELKIDLRKLRIKVE